tara:strand:+ start:1768 stop:3207 length:1440 start_codon:yes stop_codon:yes gene_type:complete
MLGSIRKFSNTIYAKLLLFIIVIPFIFWGMGSSFTGGSKNVIFTLDKEKYSITEFSEYINSRAGNQVDVNQIEKFLSDFISEKLIEKEIESLKIKLSDKSLAKLIKHQKSFKRDNEFSRTEYEKFLIKNNITATNFEHILSNEEKKKQLLEFIGGGILPPKFLINIAYDKINQKREIETINLNEVFRKKLNFSESEISDHYKNNIKKYTEIYKSIQIIEINPNKLVGNEEFNDLFFKKIDEIDDLIIEGKKISYILNKFNLEKADAYTINESGVSLDQNKINIPEELIIKVFSINESEPTILIEHENKYFLSELIKTDSIKLNLESSSTRKKILKNLENETKIKLISEIIGKINKNNYTKLDFDKLSKDENINIQKIKLNNRNDDKALNKQLVTQIYSYPEKKVILVNAIDFSEIYLVYTNKIESAKIKHESEDYIKYLNLSQARIVNDLYTSYDSYLKKKYEIVINYKSLDTIKNYFN